MKFVSKETNPLQAIKLKCIDCMCGQKNEVKLCPSQDCSLYAFRLGKNPYRKPRQYSEEQKHAMAERLRQNHWRFPVAMRESPLVWVSAYYARLSWQCEFFRVVAVETKQGGEVMQEELDNAIATIRLMVDIAKMNHAENRRLKVVIAIESAIILMTLYIVFTLLVPLT